MEAYNLGTGMFTPSKPQFMQDVRQGSGVELVSKTVAISTGAHVIDATARTVIIELPRSPILDKYGAFIGSFWGASQNKQYEAPAQAVVETDAAAAFAIYDATINLENIFEGTGNGRYMAELIDGDGNRLYGWIGGVTTAGSVYTFSVFNGLTLATQSWFQGDATGFAATNGVTAKIYRYSTSVTWSSADTFTEEVPYHDPEDYSAYGYTEFRMLNSLTNGQYAVDYKRGRIFARKANADDTEVITYRTYGDAVLTPNILTISTTVGAGAVRLTATANTIAKTAVIQSPFANTANIQIGTSTVDAATETTGIVLAPGNSMSVENVDLNTLYMDVLVDNEDVTVLYFT